MPDTYRVTWRDRLAHRLANAAMRIATPQYRAFVEVASHRGAEGLMNEAIAKRKGRDCDMTAPSDGRTRTNP